MQDKENIWSKILLRCLPERLRTPGILEFIRYLVIGGLTFLLSIGLFILMYNTLRWNDTLAKVISELCGILFAYFTNKRFVFRTHCGSRRDLLREAILFFSARAATFVLGIGAYELMARLIGREGLLANLCQLMSTVLVILLNYVFSKLFIFRPGDGGKRRPSDTN